MSDHHLIRFGERTVAAAPAFVLGAASCREVDQHGAGFHRLHGVDRDQGRCGAARDQRGGDHHVGLLRALMDQRRLAREPRWRHRPRIATDALRGFALFIGFVRHVEKLRAERFDLLFHRWTNVRRFDHRAQTLGRCDSLQTGHARTENQHARRLHGAGGGHQHRHEARIERGGQQHRLVAGNVRL